MTLWVVRAGKSGEHEAKFLDDSCIYATKDGLNSDLGLIPSQHALRDVLGDFYADAPIKRLSNWASQMWPFAHEMKPGDWVLVPSKVKAAIHVAEITGGYRFTPGAVDPYYHSRTVRWLQQDVPRSRFDADLLYTIGAFMSIFRASRNDAEARIRAMFAGPGGVPFASVTFTPEDEVTIESDLIDLERFARDQIAKRIIAKYKGDALEGLVDAVLRAQGYTTWRSPKGIDRGVDILAAPGPLGFGSPRICVQVKSQDSPVGREVLDQLVGTMQNVQAEQGLLVAWGGFKNTVDRDPAQFFRVRLWDQDELINQLLQHYDALDDEWKAELPLKRVWALAAVDEGE